MKKQTAVEWLYTQLQMNNEILEKGTRVHQEIEKKIFDQAKEMEQKQMIEKYQNGYLDSELDKLMKYKSEE
jgi:hypothetical protein